MFIPNAPQVIQIFHMTAFTGHSDIYSYPNVLQAIQAHWYYNGLHAF